MKTSHLTRLLALAIAVAAAIVAAPVAQAATPAAGYEQFAGCPTKAEEPSVAVCVRSVVKGGHFQIGSKDVPLANQMTLTGGANASLGGFVANSEGGLSATKQQVPGGLIGLTGLDWLVNFLNLEGLKLYAVTELVGTPEIGETIELPVRVHLINPTLGNNCYVGSPGSPIMLDMTPYTTSPPPPNEPISGSLPELEFDPGTGIVNLANGVYVDNSFSAPGASGCVLKLFGFIPLPINGIVNLQSGLPAAAGTNETVQEIDIESAPVSAVYP